MSAHPIFRVRRLAIAARLVAGDKPRPSEWRRAALEPFDEWVPDYLLEPETRSVADPKSYRPPRRLPGPSF